MKRVFVLLAAALLVLGQAHAADDVRGLWKVIDDKTQKPNAIVLLYLNGGDLYGRILVTIDTANGKVIDNWTAPVEKTTKLKGDPFIAGMDFVYRMKDKGREWFGFIVDPQPGDEYECVITKQGGELKVRGQLKGFGILGRDQKWVAASAADLPAGVGVPDPSVLVPVIPVKK